MYYTTSRLTKKEADAIYSREEYWVPIKGYEGLYEINNFGQIKRLARMISRPTIGNFYVPDKLLKVVPMSTGYLSVSMTKDGKQTECLVHRLYAEAFIPNPNNLPCVNHIDGNKLNNDLSNLEWCSYSVNNRHATNTCLRKICSGEETTSSKISNSDAHDIRYMYTYKNIGVEELSKEYNLSKTSIRAIIGGFSYKTDDPELINICRKKVLTKKEHNNKPLPIRVVLKIRDYLKKNKSTIAKDLCELFNISLNQAYKIMNNPKYGLPTKRGSLTEKQIVKIRNLLSKGVTHSKITKMLGVTKSQLSKIANNLSYKNIGVENEKI